MTKLFSILLLGSSLVGLNAQSNLQIQNDTNTVKAVAVEQAEDKSGGYEFTLGGGGISIEGEDQFGVDVSVSANIFKNVWVGMVQSLYWEPKFAGSTDVNVNLSWPIFGKFNLNTGWSAGVVYYREDSKTDEFWRTGPEVTVQYYVADNAFLYAGTNYDLAVTEGEKGFRYSFGIGLAF